VCHIVATAGDLSAIVTFAPPVNSGTRVIYFKMYPNPENLSFAGERPRVTARSVYLKTKTMTSAADAEALQSVGNQTMRHSASKRCDLHAENV